MNQFLDIALMDSGGMKGLHGLSMNFCTQKPPRAYPLISVKEEAPSSVKLCDAMADHSEWEYLTHVQKLQYFNALLKVSFPHSIKHK